MDQQREKKSRYDKDETRSALRQVIIKLRWIGLEDESCASRRPID